MLRAIGDDGRITLLFSGDPRHVDAEWPAAEFNHAIVAIPGPAPAPGWPEVDVGGAKYVIFDPTDPYTPLGVLPGSDQGGFALIVSPSHGQLVRLPMADPAQSRLARTVDATLDRNGKLSVRVVEDRFGWAAAREYGERRERSFESFRDAIEQRMHESHPLFTDFELREHWQPAPALYRLEIGFASPAYGRVLPNGMILVSPDALPGAAVFSPWKLKADGVAYLGPDAEDEEERIELPAGYVIEEMPDPWSEELKPISCSLDYDIRGRTLIFRSHLARHAGFYGPADYEAIRGAYRDQRDQARRPVLIRPTPPS